MKQGKKWKKRISVVVLAAVMFLSAGVQSVRADEGEYNPSYIYEGEGYDVNVSIDNTLYVDIYGDNVKDMNKTLTEIFTLPRADEIKHVYMYYYQSGRISKEAMQLIASRTYELVVFQGENLDKGFRITDFTDIANDFETSISQEQRSDISKKILDAGVSGKTYQFTLAGSGFLPGTTYVWFTVPDGTFAGTSDNEKYIYRYIEEKNAFEFVSREVFYSEKTSEEMENQLGCDSLVKTGSYVVSDEKFPDSIVTDSTGGNDANRTVPYYSLSVDGGTWDGSHYTKKDGTIAKDVFFFDGSNTYYLQADGTPMKDRLTYHPDGQHIIYLDSNGHEVFNSFQYCPSVGYTCYFDSNGYIYKDQITFVGDKTYYLNGNGKMENEGWFQFANGRDYGFANWDGNLNTEGFSYDPWGRVVFYHWNGMVARGLITDGAYYYNMDMKDGHYLGSFPVN